VTRLFCQAVKVFIKFSNNALKHTVYSETRGNGKVESSPKTFHCAVNKKLHEVANLQFRSYGDMNAAMFEAYGLGFDSRCFLAAFSLSKELPGNSNSNIT